jgi:hypothetical protein
MLSTAKILNLFSNDQTIQRPGSISLTLNPQQLYHHSTSFTPSPTNPSGGLSLSTQLRSLQSRKKKKFPFACAAAATSTSSIVEDAMLKICIDRQSEREERTQKQKRRPRRRKCV